MDLSIPTPPDAAFLWAWKRAVNLAGPNFFTAKNGYKAPKNVDEATSKWQLIPDWEVIRASLRHLSHWEAYFLVSLYSFYNDEDAEILASEIHMPRTLNGCTHGLDETRTGVLAHLMLSYRGW